MGIVTEGEGWAWDVMLLEKSVVVGVLVFFHCPVWQSPAPVSDWST